MAAMTPSRFSSKLVATNKDGAPVSRISPAESVYSFFLFITPIEEARAPGQLTTGKILSWLILLTSLVLQGVIIFAIYYIIVLGNAEWMLSVVTDTPVNSCNTGSSLCRKVDNGMITCAPPSVQLAGRWTELDIDGDGNWTRSEAEELKESIYCKFHVNPVEVFDVFVTFLINRENIIWIHPGVRAGQGIPKSYFTYAAGDIIMCGYRDEKMCPNLLEKGVFDAPLRFGGVPRVGTKIQTALEYCYGMLEDGGICDRTLPSTYQVWKKSSQEQCYGTGFNKFVYEHPKSGQEKSLLAVDYSATKDYKKAERDVLFMVYKSCVIMVLLLSVFTDMRELAPLVTLIFKFPSAASLERDGQPVVESIPDPDDDDNIKYKVHGITKLHRLSIAFVCLVRFAMFVALTGVGVMFLLKENDYLNLILNGLGLLFIVLLPNDLYNQMLSPYLRSQCENVEALEVEMFALPANLNRNPSLKDILWLAVTLVILFVSVYIYTLQVVIPVTEALQCACLSEGETCREASSFSNSFWESYWHHDVPLVIGNIKQYENAWKTGAENEVSFPIISNLTGSMEHDVAERIPPSLLHSARSWGSMRRVKHKKLRRQSTSLID